jgi:RNA polymerase sporulation-specific sigma factor
VSLALIMALLAGLVPGLYFLTGYIGGNAFPQPLAAPEEARQLALMRQGSAAARQRLIEHNLRLVAHVVKKFDNTGEDVDDLISIGCVGLIKAIDTFDPAKGVRLATYAARCIENEILMHLRNLRKSRTEVSLYDPIGVDREGNEITLLDILGSDADAVPDEVTTGLQWEAVRRYLSALDPKERLVIETRFGIGQSHRVTQREIARTLGISRSYVSRIEKRAVQKLLKEIDPEATPRQAK